MDLNSHRFSLDQLRGLIGARVEHEGVHCEIIEILEDGPALILQECETHPIIQADQHGEAHRRVPTTQTIPIFGPDRKELNPIFLKLGIINDSLDN